MEEQNLSIEKKVSRYVRTNVAARPCVHTGSCCLHRCPSARSPPPPQGNQSLLSGDCARPMLLPERRRCVDGLRPVALASGDREAKVIRPLRSLLERRHFPGTSRAAVFAGDLPGTFALIESSLPGSAPGCGATPEDRDTVDRCRSGRCFACLRRLVRLPRRQSRRPVTTRRRSSAGRRRPSRALSGGARREDIGVTPRSRR
jgi:hypothetical protein